MNIIDYVPNMPLTWHVCGIGEVDLCHHIAGDCQTFFDIGARTKSHIVDNVYDPNKTYHLFEPLPHFVSELREKYKDRSNVIIHQLGLGSRNSVLDFYEASESFINREVFKQEKPSLQVPVTTLDKFCDKNKIDYIDFLKIDTEGFELEVLYGAKKMIGQSRIKYLQFEYSDTYLDAGLTLQKVISCFSPDWKMYLLQPQTLVRIPREYFPYMERYQYNNFLATKAF